MDFTLDDTQRQLQTTMRRFVDNEVIPVASEYEHADAYPDPMVKQWPRWACSAASCRPTTAAAGSIT